MDRKELIKKYIEFFKDKGHAEIRNSSLIPENDPTVLFTTAGMHPLVPFLMGEKHPQGNRLVNVQKCIRTGDIDEVGDDCHLTFFEMLGNWSLGDYFKKEAIEFSFEFLTKELEIDKGKISVSCFEGDKDIEKDEESAKIWKDLGIKKIDFLGKKDNWWGPAGNTGPCGPDTEMFYDGLEIWNDVFMQYNKNEKGSYDELKQKNVDTGMGLERTLAILSGKKDVYETEVLKPLIEKIEELSGKKYKDNKKEMRIIADHVRAAVFIMNDGIVPGNSEQGYVLRRLIRRAVRYSKKLGIPQKVDLTTPLVKEILKIYSSYDFNKQKIIDDLNKEEDQFEKTLDKGLREFERMVNKDNQITSVEAFLLYQSYGFPIEMIKELAEEKGVKVDENGFNVELKKHQELSRTASAGKFKSGLGDDSEATKKLHTATHMLNEALRIVLDNKEIYQRGSNITSERLRFDFNFDRKVTREELDEVEKLINEKIQAGLSIMCEEMSVEDAKKAGAQGIFDDKYSEKVKVYTIGDFSKEICAGPHVENTSELGTFKIKKEGSSSAGVRRIKAVLE